VIPRAAKLSMFGVAIKGLPANPKASARHWSGMIQMMFGRRPRAVTRKTKVVRVPLR
jgi:hypothetical protein